MTNKLLLGCLTAAVLATAFATTAQAASVAVMPLPPTAIVDEDRTRNWWGAVLEGARAIKGVELQGDDGGAGFYFEQLGSQLPTCLADYACVADIAASDGKPYAIRTKISGNGGRLELKIALLRTDPFEVVRELVYDEAVVGAEAEAALVTRAVRYVLATLASESDRAQLTVTADVEGAAVKIDGKPAGMAPFDKYDLNAGVHLVEVTTDDSAFGRLVDCPARENTVVEAVLPVAKKPASGGNGLAWTATGSGLGLLAAGGGLLAFAFVEAGRLDGEIAAQNATGGFSGEDDPELVRIRDETGRTHILTGVAAGALVVGAALTTLGVMLFFDAE